MSSRPKPPSAVIGFFLLIAWFAIQNGWEPLLLICFAAALHELGHWLVLQHYGAAAGAFRFSPFGVEMQMDSSKLSYGQELAAALAGPAVNLVLGFALAICARFCDWEDGFLYAGAHLVLGAFNLLPIRPLDGGRALSLLLFWSLGPDRGEMLSAWVGAVAGLAASGGLIWLMAASGGSLWLAPAAMGLMICALGPKERKNRRKSACI